MKYILATLITLIISVQVSQAATPPPPQTDTPVDHRGDSRR